MAYFANGTEGMAYEARWCDKCAHNHPEHSCPCLGAHVLWNYDECNKPDSILHKMIPRDKDGNNGKCIFFAQGETQEKPDPLVSTMNSLRQLCFGKNNG